MTINKVFVVITLLLAVASMCAASDEADNIEKVIDAIDKEGAAWVAANTSVSYLQMNEKMALTMPLQVAIAPSELESAPYSIQFVKNFDWRDVDGINYVTPVRSQGSCGSCWAFSAIGIVESAFKIAGYTEDIDLSEQQLVSDCCSAGGCEGGWPDHSLEYITQSGVTTEDCMPYINADSGCNPCSGWEVTAFKIKGHSYVESTTDAFKWALEAKGPLSVVLCAPEDWYYYRSGIYEPVWTGVGWANHAVILVGWNDDDGCWIVKNSWGPNWGEQGYARVKYGNLEKYNYAYAVTGVIDHGASPDTYGWTVPITAIASTEHSISYPASNAVDSDEYTHWFSSYNTVDPYIVFDLGADMTIDKVRVMIHNYDIPMEITLEVYDGQWTLVVTNYSVTRGSEYVNVSFDPVNCSKVKVSMDGPRTYGTCTEFAVWKLGDVDPPVGMQLILDYLNESSVIVPVAPDGLTKITLVRDGNEVLNWYPN